MLEVTVNVWIAVVPVALPIHAFYAFVRNKAREQNFLSALFFSLPIHIPQSFGFFDKFIPPKPNNNAAFIGVS